MQRDRHGKQIEVQKKNGSTPLPFKQQLERYKTVDGALGMLLTKDMHEELSREVITDVRVRVFTL